MSSIFDLTAARFSRATALSLAQFSELVYRDESEVRAVLEEGGMRFSWIDSERTDTQAFIASDGQINVVCFRGTASPRDWVSDLKTRRIPYVGVRGLRMGQGEVHRGFMDCWESVEAELLHLLYEEHVQDGPTLVCGHSLGGALAMICADQLSAGSRRVRLYTFGQPRTGDAPFSSGAVSRLAGYHRFVHNNDVVARVPFSGWGFRHSGRLNHFDHTGKLLLEPAAWVTFADRVIGRVLSRKLNPLKWTSDGLDDHSMSGYVRLIQAWASAPE